MSVLYYYQSINTGHYRKQRWLDGIFKLHIPSREFSDSKIPSNIQVIPSEINLRKEKLLVASIYNAPSQKNKYFIWYLTNLLEFYSTRHEKVIILGDFNKNTENKVMKDFLREDTFYSLMKQNTCFKGDEGFVHRFANFKFEIFVYEDKLLSNWFE